MPPAGYKRSRALWDETRRPDSTSKDLMRAILYEIQPIRLSKINQRHYKDRLYNTLSTLLLVIRSIPGVVTAVAKFLRALKFYHWLLIGCIVLYYYFVRWMHEFLEAGPLVIIITCLALIFTIGLGDNDDRDGISAYAVFNRGFERLLGSVDAEALMAQHLGGGLAAHGAMMAAPPQDNDEQGPARRRRQNRNREGGNQNIDADRDEDAVPNNNRARKSGKKARRRDLAQRREIQNQREAAAALGMRMGNEGLEEQVAMQRLIEEQIAAEN